MSSANSSIDLPNPYTPMAWLPPETAFLFEASRYIYIACLGAFAWDWLTSLPVEYDILKTVGLRTSTVIYFTSRAASMAYILTSTIFQVAAVPNCQALQVALGICYIFADPATSALFYLRVIAVYQRRLGVVVFFGICMVAVLGCSVLVPTGISGVHIGTTQYCVNESPKEYVVAAPVVSTIFDTLVFLAISYKLSGFSSSGESWQVRMKSFFGGSSLPRFSRMLLQGGQMYYGATVTLNIVAMALLLTTSLPGSVRVMLTIPNIALENAMATRVFREVHMGRIRQKSLSEGSMPVQPESIHLSRLAHSHGVVSRGEAYPHDPFIVAPRINVKDQIHVTKETTHDAGEKTMVQWKRGDVSDEESGFSRV